jgi:hypothetical protein
MRSFLRTVATTLLLLFLPAPSGRAQSMIDVSGHWQGAIQAPDMAVEIALDLAVNAKGQLAGTFSEPMENIKGLPLSTVTVDGRTVHLVLKPGGGGGGVFKGTVSEDGKSMRGDFIMGEGKFVAPFSLTRTGEAQIAPPPRSPAISKFLAGTWQGTLEAGAQRLRLQAALANQADGSSMGTMISLDGTNVEVPVAISERGDEVTIEVPSVGASFIGVMNSAKTEIVGTWKEPKAALPLTLKRVTQ